MDHQKQTDSVIIPSDNSFRVKATIVSDLDSLNMAANADNSYAKYFTEDDVDFLQQMAASVAHEVRNPIQAARGLMQVMTLRYSGDKDFLEMSQNVIDQLDFANKILTSFLNFSSPDYGDKVYCNPSDLVHEIYLMMRGLALLSGINFIEDYQYVDKIFCNDGAIKQILINLIRNALEASAKNDRIVLSTCKVNNDVVISVSDIGAGMTSTDLNNVFKAFVTTKKKGNGLGLTICCRICRSIGARFEVETEKDHGTKFSLILPIEKTD